MIEFAPSDFDSLERFSRGWRFSAERIGDTSVDTIARIRPLTPERAADIAQIAVARRDENASFGTTFRSDDSPGLVREKLTALPIVGSIPVLVSWDRRTAVVTDWETFIVLWDDLCYPSSDDVTIWPFDGQWTLCYRHYEIFQFDSHERVI
ncbi:MAG: hypothetical protein JWO05_1039 [Gemmatimonadetes bacterium]|nr:hypothetical protein [Gemmatimonadota bacterium]